MKIGELIFNLGFNADTMKLKDFGKALGDLNMSSIVAATGFGAVYEGAKKLINIADDMALGINKFGRETGQSTQEVQKWSAMAAQMGISAGTVENSVAHLQDSIHRMKMTGEGSNFWGMLGIDPTRTKDMFQVLTMLREKLKGMSIESQRFYLENLGISTEMLNMFKLTDAQWAEIPKEQAISNVELAKMAQYHQKIQKLGHDIQVTWTEIGVNLIPVAESIITMTDNFNNFVRNSEGFKEFLKVLSESLTNIGKVLIKSAEGWGLIFKATGMGLGAASHAYGSGLKWSSDLGNSLGFHDRGSSASFQEPPIVKLNIKHVVQTTDPNTKVMTFQEHFDKALDDFVHVSPPKGGG